MIFLSRLIAKLKNYVTPIFYIALLIFLIGYVRNIDFDLLGTIGYNWPYIATATLIGLMSRYWGGFIWQKILEDLGAKKIPDNTSLLFHIYSKAWLGRYIPGTAPWILGKIYFAAKHGIAKTKLAISSLLEAVVQIVVTIATGLLLITLNPQLPSLSNNLKVVSTILLICCVVFLTPPVFNRFVLFIFKIIRKQHLIKGNNIVQPKAVLRTAGLYVIASLLSGLSMFFIAKAVHPELPLDTVLFIIGATNLAGGLGMVVVFLPSGIGVREVAVVLLLSSVMPTEIAVIVSVTTRIWSILVDLLFFASTRLNLQFLSSNGRPM